ncbi:MAG: 2,3-bisphosphoglycerate-independent phosphoglycerate mutase [Arenicellales bacterium]|nr:2,3-bisphosphoglycerate-independent phosphoglycerate mutase [Arenicellales bacterium]
MTLTPLEINKQSEIRKGPLVLLILDGVGIGREDQFNAVHLSRTPTLDALSSSGTFCALRASGTAVGLPSDTDIGGSEVGHNIMGAGRVLPQGATIVENAFGSERIWLGAWKRMMARLKSTGGALHLVGLLSDGNVHSHESHLHAMLKRSDQEGLKNVYVHVLLDGRDVPDQTAEIYVDRLESVMANINCKSDRDYRIASGGGRMTITMDRYGADWSMVARGWNAMVHGIGERFPSAADAIRHFRQRQPGINDQYLPGFVVAEDKDPPKVTDGDGVILFNFRGDRAVELTQAFCEDDDFSHFDRGRIPDTQFMGMMLYDGDLDLPKEYLISPEPVSGSIGEYLAATGITQLACAETQKFGHVTYFWNGNRSGKFDEQLETYVEIPSDNVPFDQKPWMKSAETADVVISSIEYSKHQFIRCNFPGGDMVGHTGNLEATIIALEAIDLAIKRIIAPLEKARGCLVVTADHGNADNMVERDKTDKPRFTPDGVPLWRTAHSLNPVPFIVKDYSGHTYDLNTNLHHPGLGNIAATLIEILGFKPPEDYEPSLILRNGMKEKQVKIA